MIENQPFKEYVPTTFAPLSYVHIAFVASTPWTKIVHTMM
jgi:hypothetical protein